MKSVKLVDAIKMSKENPDTFFVPSKEELKRIDLGNFVKVCAFQERFWVMVVDKKENGDFLGMVSNDLFTNELSKGDLINFNQKNIYDIY